MEKCLSCTAMTGDLYCLLDGELKDEIQLNMPQSECEVNNAYKKDRMADFRKIKIIPRSESSCTKEKVISFNSEVSMEDSDIIYKAHLSRDKNILSLEFEGDVVPYPVLSKKSFTIRLEIPEEEVGCGECDTCITPIC